MPTNTFVFFGTPYVARDTLAILFNSGYVPALVVTAPDRPRGRGMHMTPSETKEWAQAHDIPVITPEKITDEVIAEIRATGATYGLVAAYGKILPESLIAAFPLGILNVHYSLLPKYRGASPVEAALLAGDTVTGVAIQQMVPAMDAGDLLALQEVPIEPTETTKELRPRLVTIGAELLVSILPDFLSGTIQRTPQDPSNVSKCKKITKEMGHLDLSADPILNWKTYRAYAESPGTYFLAERGGRTLRVKIAKATYQDGSFGILRVVPEGKAEQDYSQFLQSLTPKS
jgi:methionyl-tRNA formyltransferase